MLQGVDSVAADTAAATSPHPPGARLDSVVVETPLPDPIAPVVRFLFNLPQWIQIWGAVLGVIVAIVLLVVLWKRRARIIEWLRTRSHGAKIAIGTGAAVLVLALAGFGAFSWNYMQHDNDFCSGCHVMTGAFDKFQQSEHSKLQCHDCHRQSIFASARQLVLWVAERPDDIPPHAKVPTAICAECHIQEQPDSVWQRIIATAGHRLHLNSDSSALKDVQCVTCHGLEIHRFVPVDSTCGQAQCHDNIDIRLGKMREQTDLHCVTCHEFTAPTPELTSLDSTRQSLVPGQNECFSCHEMRQAMATFVAGQEPHDAKCGTCHNPHVQETPQAAFKTCTDAGCHANPAQLTPFHRGIGDRALAECGSCHQAHTWSISGEKCLECHRDIFNDRPRRVPARAEAGARSLSLATPVSARLASVTREHERPLVLAALQQNPAEPQGLGYQGPEPFSHSRHRDLSCTACHQSNADQHGALSVKTLRDCQSCHHAAERAEQCTSCHSRSELAGEKRVATQIELSVWQQPKERALPFRHAWHESVTCASCHTTPVTLEATATCASCHNEHHQAQRECRFCHESGKPTHTRTAHLGCAGSGCHTMSATVSLRPTREVCLTCHQDKVTHRPGRVCAECHEVRWLASRSGA